MTPLVALTGASGGIGQALLPKLLARASVRALFRKPISTAEQPVYQIIPGDLSDSHALDRLVTDADIVIHAAAKVIGFKAKEFNEINVEGTRRLAAAAKRAGCRRFVYISSIAAYLGTAPRDHAYTEDLSLLETPDNYGRSKLMAEHVLVEELSGSRTEFTILRPTCVYGPGVKSWTLIPLASITKGRSLFLGMDSGAGLMDAVYVDDVVEGILAAALAPGAANQVFNLGHETVSFAEFYSYLGEIGGKTPKLGSEASLRKLGDKARRGARFAKFLGPLADGMDTILKMSLNQSRYPSDKARHAFGYAPAIRLTEGMFLTELWLRERNLFPASQRQIFNTDKHYAIRPNAVVRPHNERELVETVTECWKRKLKIKAAGALHSFVPIPDTGGVCIRLDRCKEILNVSGTSVTVQGGITLRELNLELDKRGLALPIQGSHSGQTIAGAIATSTHGGSLHHGTMADYVEALRIVKAHGEVVEISTQDPHFPAAVVSLGLLGITSAVTLRCVPKFWLQAVVDQKSFDEVIRDWDDIHQRNEYVDLRYFPRLGIVETLFLNRVEPPRDTPTAHAAPKNAPPNLPPKVVSFVARAMFRGIRLFPFLEKPLVRKLLGTTYRQMIGPSYEVLSFTNLEGGETFPIDDLEFAVPYHRGAEALQALADHFKGSRNPPRFFPVHLRCSKAGQHWLSPNYGQDVCWFEFWQHPPNPELYDQIHHVLDPMAYRPHWAKMRSSQPIHILTRFPKAKDFLAVQKQWDPEGRFVNPYLTEKLLAL